MSKREKLLARLKDKPKDFTWDEAKTLMCGYDFDLLKASGSRRKFFHKEKNIIIIIHKPHPHNVLLAYQVKDLIEGLKDSGVIKDE